MKQENLEKIKTTIKTLKSIQSNSSISGKDTTKYWIIDTEEDKALKTVISLLKDLI